MVADSDHSSIPARRLAERLKDLREREYEPLTQKQLARILGGSITMISLWENPGSNRLPPPQRLATYARLFCTGRSFASGSPRLLSDDELTEPEREREAGLYDELLALRDRAQSTVGPPSREQPSPDQPRPGPRSSIWHFPDGSAVSIIDGEARDAPSYAAQSHLNYSQYARFADLDALIEVFAQVKADNPVSMIRILSPHELVQDFALNHLVIVGDAAWREVGEATPFFSGNIVTVLPDVHVTGETYVFECRIGEERRTFSSVHAGEALTQEVGLIARAPHPIIPTKFVTLLSGSTSRGVHGAALCFTDSHVRYDNERYLREAFGNADTFCVVMNIPIANNTALPTNLWLDNVRLYEWSAETGARW